MNELLQLNEEELIERLWQTDKYNEMFCILMVLRKKGCNITSIIERQIAFLEDKRLIAEFRSISQMTDKSVDFRFGLNALAENEIIHHVRQNPNLLFYILHPSVPIIIAVLTKDKSLEKCFQTDPFKLMSGTSEDKQLEIVTQNPELMQYITKPSERFLIEAVKRNDQIIRYIKKPSLNVKMEALRKNYKSIIYMDNILEMCCLANSPEIKEFLIENNGLNIRYIDKPSLTLQERAIKDNGCAIQFIKNPSIPIQKLAVQRDSMAIRYINNPPLEIMLESVKNDSFSIQFIKNPPIEVQLKAVQGDGEAIKFIKDPSLTIQLEAVKESEFAIRYIENPTKEVQIESVKCHPSSIAFIKDFDQASFDLYSSIKVEQDVKSRVEFKPSYAEKLETIPTENSEHRIIDWQDNLCDHINYLCRVFEVQRIKIATGFAFKSGLELVSSSFQRALNNQGTIELVIGSLQKYRDDPNDKVMGMDAATAGYLNDLISKGVKLKTYKNSFYHGKFYWLEGKATTSIIMGSSNVSMSGFRNNREFNSLFLLSNESAKYQEFKYCFEKLWQECEDIGQLNPECFSPLEREYHYQENLNINRVNEEDVQQKLKTLTDEEIVARMNLWLSKMPNSIYSDLEINNLRDYLLFEYKDYDLVVFESMTSGNSYYYFYKQELNTLIKLLKHASKTEIFNLSQMHKRGYHIQNSSNLEIAINNLFIKSYQNQI